MIRALIFDCFGVLYRDNLSVLYDLIPIEKQRDMQDIIHACDHGYITRAEYFEKLGELSGKTPQEMRAVDRGQHSKNEQLFSYVKELKKTYKIGLLSNIGDETMDRLFSQADRELFDTFVLSSDIGVIKPALAAFEITAERLDVPADQCVMIDDLPANIDAAQLVGMRGIVFANNRQFEEDLAALLERENARTA